MEQILPGGNIKTKEGFEMVLQYAKSKTLNITFDMIITSIINQAENTCNLDPRAALDDLVVHIAQACFCGETIIVFDKVIVDNQNQNMKFFLRRCVAELAALVRYHPEVQHEFMAQCLELTSKIIMNQLL